MSVFSRKTAVVFGIIAAAVIILSGFFWWNFRAQRVTDLPAAPTPGAPLAVSVAAGLEIP